MAKTTFIFTLDASLMDPSREDIERVKANLRKQLGEDANIVVLSPGCNLFAATEGADGQVTITGTAAALPQCGVGAYAIRERMGNYERELHFATHAELMVYVNAMQQAVAANVHTGPVTVLARTDEPAKYATVMGKPFVPAPDGDVDRTAVSAIFRALSRHDLPNAMIGAALQVTNLASLVMYDDRDKHLPDFCHAVARLHVLSATDTPGTPESDADVEERKVENFHRKRFGLPELPESPASEESHEVQDADKPIVFRQYL